MEEEKREERNPEDSSQSQLRIQHNLNWEEYITSLNDSGGLQITRGAYFGGTMFKLAVGPAAL